MGASGDGSLNGMRTTIDAAGRVVIPKQMRDQLGLAGREEVEVELDGVEIRITRPSVALKLVGEGQDVYFVPEDPETELPPLTTETVRDVLEQLREGKLR